MASTLDGEVAKQRAAQLMQAMKRQDPKTGMRFLDP
jgi:hypothetical protein